jgi:Ca2+-binding RTX toxin-like protein
MVLAGANQILNSTILGSDITGTLTGADSLSIDAVTIQTSTVYGGAGNDTILFGGTNANTQIISGDFRAFAGSDSISAVGSFVSSTVRAGSGNDTMYINTSTAGTTASTATEFYGGIGADLISAANAANVTIYADATSSDTAGGADSLVFGSFTSSTVYGAAGSDTLLVNYTHDKVYVDLGTGASLFTGAGGITASTLIGGASNDTFNFGVNGITSTSIVGGAGVNSFKVGAFVSSTVTSGDSNDTFAFNSNVTRSSILGGGGNDSFSVAGGFNNSTLLGGAGADSASFVGVMTASRVDLSGTGNSLISASGNINASTLLGGAGADTLNLTGAGVTSTRVIAGASNDIINFSAYVTGTSIVGGAGNDSVTFTFTAANTVGSGNTTSASTNTYFFGSGAGLDTISFANVSTNAGSQVADLTIAVDSSYGVTSGMTFTTATSLITFSTGVASIFVEGVTGGSAVTNGQASVLGFTLTTVSSSVITALG